VTWQTVAGFDVHARRLSPSGQLLGAEVAITADPQWQTDPDVVYHPARDEYFVAYADEVGNGQTAVYGQRILPSTGAPVGARILIAQAAGTWIPDVELVPASGQYLVSWYQGGVFARLLNGDGTPAGAVFQLAPGFGSYDAMCIAYNPVSATFAGVFNGSDDEVWAADIFPAGSSSPPVRATDSPGPQANYYPRLAASTRRAEWLAVASRGYANPVVQLLRR
jgi:hypothetical protein